MACLGKVLQLISSTISDEDKKSYNIDTRAEPEIFQTAAISKKCLAIVCLQNNRISTGFKVGFTGAFMLATE